VRQSEYIVDRKNDEIEQLKAQIVNIQRQRFEDEHDQKFSFAIAFSIGFLMGIAMMFVVLMGNSP
jgi:hypothetical protein